MSTLPENWVKTILGNITCILRSGGTPKKGTSEYYENGEIPFIKIEDMSEDQKKLTSNNSSITKIGLENSSAWMVPEQSLLYSMYGSYGIPSITTYPVATNQAILGMTFSKKHMHLDYIYYLLKKIKPEISINLRGTTQLNLSKTIVKDFQVPLSPYNEQVRIVAKIEELFSRLDQGVKALQETQLQLKQYRHSLFNDLFSLKFDIYHKVTLGEILEPSKERFNPVDNKEAAYIGLANIESNTGRILNIGKSSETKSLKSVFHSDDLLYGRLRPYLNKVAVPNFDGVCSTDIIVFKSSEKINHNYLQYVLMSNGYVSYATNNMSGVQHPRIKFNEMAKFIFPYPPLEIQNKIHTEYEKQLSIINNMIINIKQSLSHSELLRQLILRKAFEGRLVPQDFNDEPASVLLERIKAEKVKLKVIKRRGKRRRKS